MVPVGRIPGRVGYRAADTADLHQSSLCVVCIGGGCCTRAAGTAVGGGRAEYERNGRNDPYFVDEIGYGAIAVDGRRAEATAGKRDRDGRLVRRGVEGARQVRVLGDARCRRRDAGDRRIRSTPAASAAAGSGRRRGRRIRGASRTAATRNPDKYRGDG